MQDRLTFPYEPRPRDFTARLKRRAPRRLGQRMERRHMGRRVLVLLAAMAVPALAAPGEWPGRWDAFDIANAGAASLEIEPMPFERAGDSFPGSAFYYLAPNDTPLVPGLQSDGDAAPGEADIAGAVARAIRIDNSGVDRTRALQCLTAAIYFEARSEPDQGQRAVAQVVLNRVAHPSYPNTVCGVVFQGSERRTGCQFSFTCDGSMARLPNPMFWQRAQSVAMAALAGYVEPSVGLATHYHTIAIHPYWAPSLRYLTTIGAHRFYSFMGAAGRPGAFRFAYLGGEPVAAPHARDPAADRQPDTALDPLAIQRAYDEGLKRAAAGGLVQPGDVGAPLAGTRALPVPRYSQDIQNRGGEALYRGDALPGAPQEVRPEYRDSGRWIAQPGT